MPPSALMAESPSVPSEAAPDSTTPMARRPRASRQRAKEAVDRHRRALRLVAGCEAQPVALEAQVEARRDHVGVVGFDGQAVSDLTDRQRRLVAEQFGQDALVGRGEVLHDDERHADVGGKVFEQLRDGLQAAGRSADADDGKRRRPACLWLSACVSGQAITLPSLRFERRVVMPIPELIVRHRADRLIGPHVILYPASPPAASRRAMVRLGATARIDCELPKYTDQEQCGKAGREDRRADDRGSRCRRASSCPSRSRPLPERLPLASGASYDLLTCVQEAAKNALRFAQSPDGVRIVVTASQSEVVISVRDHGTGLDLARLDDRMPDPLCESGRGLSLLVALMDKVEFRIERGTEVRLHKALRPRSRPRDHAA